MTRYVIGPDVAVRLAREEAVIRGEHQLLAPALLRSQVLSLLYQAVRRGEMTRKEAERQLEYVRALIQAAWNAIRTRGRLQARYNRLVRRFGGQKNPGAKKKAITAIAHTLLKIAYQVLKSGTPYQELGADFYTRQESPAQQHAYLERRLQKLYPGCAVTITINPPEAALTSPVDRAP
jgi:hypothetical protein